MRISDYLSLSSLQVVHLEARMVDAFILWGIRCPLLCTDQMMEAGDGSGNSRSSSLLRRAGHARQTFIQLIVSGRRCQRPTPLFRLFLSTTTSPLHSSAPSHSRRRHNSQHRHCLRPPHSFDLNRTQAQKRPGSGHECSTGRAVITTAIDNPQRRSRSHAP